jgi:hypothetical protein
MNLRFEPSFKTYYTGLYYRVKIKDSLSVEELSELWDIFSNKRDGKVKAPTSSRVMIYLHNEKQLQHFIDTVDNRKIDVIQGPINDYHKSVLDKPGLEVKNTLYYKKYRYKADYGLIDKGEARSNILSMLRNLVASDKQNFLGQNIYENRMGWSWPRIYVAGDEQLMMLKLSSDEYINHITKVVTIKEIKAHG